MSGVTLVAFHDRPDPSFRLFGAGGVRSPVQVLSVRGSVDGHLCPFHVHRVDVRGQRETEGVPRMSGKDADRGRSGHRWTRRVGCGTGVDPSSAT